MLARQLYEGILLENLYGSQVYLEIGSYDGEGIAMFSKMFPNKTFYSIDPFIEDGHTSRGTGVATGDPLNEIRETFLQNTKDCSNITHFDIKTEEFISRRLYDVVFPNVLFIDGDHSYECVKIDLQLAELLAKKNKLFVVMDDTVNIEGVVKALEEFKARHPEIRFYNLPDYGAVYFYIS
jgi:hypothetical protein